MLLDDNPLFVCSLFNDVFSVTQTKQRQMRGQVSNELGGIWKEAVVA
jgi:hypothetical protein